MKTNKLLRDNIFVYGLLVLFIINIPILILNTDILTIIHDQFDGELLTYILHAKHPFQHLIPELFNGTPMDSLTPPAPVFTVLYMFLPPEWAFFLQHILILAASYIGMYFCVKMVIGIDWISAVTGLLFSMLPYYTVYGFSVMGQPLLIIAFLTLLKDKKKMWPYVCIFFFATGSSLILSGYADIVILTVFLPICLYCKKKSFLSYLIGYIEIITIYTFLNIDLIKDIVFHSSSFVSHKTEYVLSSQPFSQSFKDIFFHGMYHAASNHLRIIWISMAVFVLAVIFLKSNNSMYKYHILTMGYLLATILLIDGFYALWHCSTVTGLRSRIGGFLVYFQADRFYWLLPCLWFMVFAYTLFFMSCLCKNTVVKTGLSVIFILYNAAFLYQNGSLVHNYHKLVNPSYTVSGYSSIKDFYQPELFSEIKAFIEKPQSSYRVCSVGIFPSIPLYNGFYCLDGYSNNYNVLYKHEFREIILPELEKDPGLKKYFDEWGNRCYIFTHELGHMFLIPNDSEIELRDLTLNFGQFQKMNGTYLLSAVPIIHSNLHLQKHFHRDNSYYDIYLYTVISDSME